MKTKLSNPNPMEQIKKNLLKDISKLAMVILIIFAYSCSEDKMVLQDDLDKMRGKTNTSDLKTLVRGAAINSANGIAIGPDGNLYVASVLGQDIVVMNKNSGKIIDRITEGVQSPDDLVFGPDGSLYWTDLLTGEVGRRTPGPNGIVTSQDGDFTKFPFRPGVNPIAFNDEGRLFIALDFQGDGLYEFDPEFNDGPRTIVECAFPLDPNPCLGFFNSFDFGPDGRLYGPLFAFNLIISVNVDEGNPSTSNPFDPSSELDLQVVAGDGDFEFNNPAAAKFGPDGLLYVLDQSGQIVKIDIENNNDIIPFTTLEPGLDNMVFDEDGSLYVTNADQGWVKKILPSGQARTISPGGMIVPQGIAVMTGPNNKDMIFQADLFSLKQFNGSNGQQEDQFKGFLVPPPDVKDPLTLPQNVSTSGNDLIISSFFNSTVQVWNPELADRPEGGVTENYFVEDSAPIDAVRLSSGEVIVSDIGRGGVFSMNDPATLIQKLFAASGLATDGTFVWAADWGSGVIYKIDVAGGTSDPVYFVPEGSEALNGPEGLAIDHEGRLLVFETGGPFSGEPRLSRIEFFSDKPAERTTIVDGLEPKQGGLPFFPPMWLFDGVDVGVNGDIYLTGGEANVIHKIPQSKVK